MRKFLYVTPFILSGLVAIPPIYAMDSSYHAMNANQSRETAKAEQLVNAAVGAVHQMKEDRQLRGYMREAKGIFIVPKYGRVALVVGGRGGKGVMLKHDNHAWSNPVFYNIGGLSVGAQAGAEGGSIAMLLMTDKAVNAFNQQNNFSVGADAGLTVVNYSARAQASTRGDIVVWGDTKGLYAGAAVNVKDVRRDNDDNYAYYNSHATTPEILGGHVSNPQATALQSVLASAS